VTNSYFRGADGVILVFDKTDYQSFLNIQEWLKAVNEGVHDHAIKIMVGNKSDMDDAVSTDVAQLRAEQLHLGYAETSAKTAENVEAVFAHIASELVKIADNKGMPMQGHSKLGALLEEEAGGNRCC
jgi:Ras-related protein Rab-1A